MNFHHIAITTRDMDKSVKFYSEVLGFKEIKSWGEGIKRIVMLEGSEGACIELFADGSALLPEGVFRHLAFNCGNTREVFDKVKKAGMEIISEPRDLEIPSVPPTPVTLAFFKGPDGEVLELFERRS